MGNLARGGVSFCSDPGERKAILEALVAEDWKRILDKKARVLNSPEAQKERKERQEQQRKWRLVCEEIERQVKATKER